LSKPPVIGSPRFFRICWLIVRERFRPVPFDLDAELEAEHEDRAERLHVRPKDEDGDWFPRDGDWL